MSDRRQESGFDRIEDLGPAITTREERDAARRYTADRGAEDCWAALGLDQDESDAQEGG